MSLSNFKFEYTRLFIVRWTVHPPCPTDYIRFFKVVYNNLESFDRNTPENQMSGFIVCWTVHPPCPTDYIRFFKAVYNNLESFDRNTPENQMSLSNFKFEYTRLFIVRWTVHPLCPTDYIGFFKAVYNNLDSFGHNTPDYSKLRSPEQRFTTAN